MSSVAEKLRSPFTVADYLTWPETERWELIEGLPHNMSPSASIRHQSIVGQIFSRLEQGLKGKPCKPFVAPVDVILSEEDVVQPDVLVVCDPQKIGEKAIHGAPDLIFEVLSPSTALKDMREKKALYQCAGVVEYVVIDPLENDVQRFVLNDEQQYGVADVFGINEALSLKSLSDLTLPLAGVFDV